jgi:hypothetical protein
LKEKSQVVQLKKAVVHPTALVAVRPLAGPIAKRSDPLAVRAFGVLAMKAIPDFLLRKRAKVALADLVVEKAKAVAPAVLDAKKVNPVRAAALGVEKAANARVDLVAKRENPVHEADSAAENVLTATPPAE